MTPDEALIESWVLSLHHKRDRTVEVYLRELLRFAGTIDHDLTQVVKEDVLRWIRDQKAAGLSQSTIRVRWIALRSFYGWAFDEDEILVNPVAKIRVDKGEQKAPDVIPPDQLEKLLKACAGSDFPERRDTAIIRLFLATGLRSFELIGLLASDLDLLNRMAMVRDGKGGKSRPVRFDPSTAAALDRYRRSRAKHKAANLPNLWLGKFGALTKDGLGPMLKRRAEQAGIPHVHPHQLRHTFADRWLDAGGSEGDLQKLGGWESPDMMRLYGRSRATDRALNAYDQIDPMGGL